VPPNCEGAVVLLGDMPAVTASLVEKVVQAFDLAEDRAICVATFGNVMHRKFARLGGRNACLQILTADIDGDQVSDLHDSRYGSKADVGRPPCPGSASGHSRRFDRVPRTSALPL